LEPEMAMPVIANGALPELLRMTAWELLVELIV
jgi:hypothetical protein